MRGRHPNGRKDGGNSKKLRLSVIIIAKNEADRIGRCLDSVKTIAHEIIVLTVAALTKTVDIARQYTGQVFVTDQRDTALKQRAPEKANGDWVLSH
ncbi:MAG: hypothetical protein R2860_10220 [Desulfobacterales bacterium]